MLVLARKKNEKLIIGTGPDAVEVTVVEIRGDKVRLGVHAPQHIQVDRAEVRDAKEREAASRNGLENRKLET